MFGTWTNPNSTVPPDVILEVGPQPCYTRYAAHGSLLALHSGYLRAALRTVDPVQSNVISGSLRRAIMAQHPHIPTSISAPSSTTFSIGAPNAETTVLYLPNVTSEQFTPLLSYMYTGYLDLTIDNIFGVLLATHLLHMPRALELCRTFLSTSSSTLTTVVHAGGLVPPPSGMQLMERSYYGQKTTTVAASAPSEVPRLVRPIASKALATVGLHFIAPPTASQISLLPTAPFRSLGPPIISALSHPEQEPLDAAQQSNHDSPSQSPISVTQYDDDGYSRPITQHFPIDNENSIDSITVDSECDKNENESNPNNGLPKDDNFEMTTIGDSDVNRVRKHSSDRTQLAVKRHKSIKLATDDGGGGNGVIIDIASCDGPVRFRRVLNVMYGCNTNNRSPHTSTSINAGLATVTVEGKKNASYNHSLRYASSFHQQMARNISYTGKLTEESSLSSSCSSVHDLSAQQQKHEGQETTSQDLPLEQNQQKDENSQEDNTPYSKEDASGGSTGSSSYTCVYCKYSFKSHYCYQKHAKRHLIPLPLDHGSDTTLLVASTTCHPTRRNGTNASNAKQAPMDGRRRSHSGSTGNNNSAAAVKREVKPLDMNVQYYPCKTCGSKFPSYYFVHKHRKLCHADEDDEATGHGNTSRIGSRSILVSSTHSKVISEQNTTSDGVHGFDTDLQSDNQNNRDHT